MKASVIIPTYKRSDPLAKALQSIGNQDAPRGSFEVIIVDNAETPTQGLQALCEETSQCTLRYVHERRTGLHNARHAGARAARGDLLIFIDDDVICPPDWLSAMIAPFDDANVAMVAGKVVLRYESSPPEWVGLFSSSLSALDLGDKAHAIPPFGSAVGCNMAVRKKALLDVGGFNPDGFGNRSLIRYRGDGESGLARKLHEAGLVVWYAPGAVLEHCVPASRMTEKYTKQRAENAGIEVVYRFYRYDCQHLVAVARFAALCAARGLCHQVLAYAKRRESPAWFRHHAAAFQHFHSVLQCGRLVCSRRLRAHTTAQTYLV